MPTDLYWVMCLWTWCPSVCWVTFCDKTRVFILWLHHNQNTNVNIIKIIVLKTLSAIFCYPFEEKVICRDCCLSVRHKNLTLSTTFPFLNISLSNFHIVLPMMSWTWCWILKVKVKFAGVLPYFCTWILSRKHNAYYNSWYYLFSLFWQSIWGRPRCSTEHLSSL